MKHLKSYSLFESADLDGSMIQGLAAAGLLDPTEFDRLEYEFLGSCMDRFAARCVRERWDEAAEELERAVFAFWYLRRAGSDKIVGHGDHPGNAFIDAKRVEEEFGGLNETEVRARAAGLCEEYLIRHHLRARPAWIRQIGEASWRLVE